MADKTVKELADMVSKTASAVQQQLVDAGLPARAEDDLFPENFSDYSNKTEATTTDF